MFYVQGSKPPLVIPDLIGNPGKNNTGSTQGHHGPTNPFGDERGRKAFDNVPKVVHTITMKASEPLSVVFFKTDSGSEPVRIWLREDLTSAQRTIIGKDLKIVQFMWPIGMPLVRPLGDGLWELRSVLDDGIARVLFTFYQNQILLLHGFIKKSAKTPKSDLALARKRKAAFKKG